MMNFKIPPWYIPMFHGDGGTGTIHRWSQGWAWEFDG